MTRKRYLLFFALTLCLLWVSVPCAVAMSGLQAVTVEGSASVRDRNYADARNRAITEALGNAVTTVIETSVPLHVRITQSGHIDEIRSAPPRNYISEYRIIDESFDGNAYGVRLTATVQTEKILKTLETLRSEPPAAMSGLTSSDARSRIIFTLAVRGIDSYARYGALKHFLTNDLPRVERVTERLIQEGLVEFEIQAQGGALEFASELASAQPPAGLAITLLNRSDSRVVVEITQ